MAFLWLLQLGKRKTKEMTPIYFHILASYSGNMDLAWTLKTRSDSSDFSLVFLFPFNFSFSTTFTATMEMKGEGKWWKCLDIHWVCVAPVFADVVEREREEVVVVGGWDRERDEICDLICSPRAPSPERPFTIINHLHGDILKLRWMGSSDAFKTRLWYKLRATVDGSHSPTVGSFTVPRQKNTWDACVGVVVLPVFCNCQQCWQRLLYCTCSDLPMQIKIN